MQRSESVKWMLTTRASLVSTLLGLALGCGPTFSAHPELSEAAQHSALAISDTLEALIAEGKDEPEDRQFAYDQVQHLPAETAPEAFARAAVTGRLVQQRGMLAANLVGDVERFARKSLALDPTFREGAAARMLGTLYVLAPAALLQHGDSEIGLEMLEELTRKRPDDPQNQLRLAEAYIALGDSAPARPHLCLARRARQTLRRDEQKLLDRLVQEVRPLGCAADP